jgi:hypothetical protein
MSSYSVSADASNRTSAINQLSPSQYLGKRTSSKLGEQVLALATGKTQQQIAAACKGARPNHVGAAIARHKRSGPIEERDGKLYAAQSTEQTQPAAV